MSERKTSGKKAKKKKSEKKHDAPAPEQGHERRFDQLLDDAIFGVTKKNPRG